jgi:hypothetical protein|nr:MAG TPA: hypothetical protein [Caudoviricetes sp.]
MFIIAKDRQCLLDLALQTAGGMEAVLKLARQNNLSLTTSLTEGQRLEAVLPMLSTPRDVVVRYAADRVYPATDLSAREATSLAQEGIEFIGIEIDFIVS